MMLHREFPAPAMLCRPVGLTIPRRRIIAPPRHRPRPRHGMPLVNVISPGAPAGTGEQEVTGDPNWASVVFLCGFEDDPPSDDSDSAHGTGTANGNAQISSVDPLIGSASALLDGSGDFYSWADSADWHMTGELTIDAVFSFTTLQLGVIASQYSTSGANRAWHIFADPGGGTMNFTVSTTGNDTITAVLSGLTFSTGVTYHVRATRDASNVLRVALDGSVGATTPSATGMKDSVAIMRIGANSAGNYHAGRIDEVRITKGVARQIDEIVTLPFPRFAA